MVSSPAGAPADPQGSHSGQWGLAGLLLGSFLLLSFPFAVALMLALLIGAWNINEVEWWHVELAVNAGWVMLWGMLGLGVLAALCGVVGLGHARRRRQPYGLAIAGTASGLLAMVAAAVLVIVGHYVTEDTQRLKAEHPRFRPASLALIQQVKALVEQNPQLQPHWDQAMKDGTLSEYEAATILRLASRRP